MAGKGTITASGRFKCAEGELSELEVAAARRNFQVYDRDGDGVISRDDFHQAMTNYKEQLGHRTVEELDEMYASVDIHGTGQVDFLTFAEMRVRKKNHNAAAASSAEFTKSAPKSASLQEHTKPEVIAPPLESHNVFAQSFSKMLGVCGCAKSRR
ncbi:MAG: hypothetical protein SGPRY_011394 [Prymnesium sp.]